jgi:hypothetical protein
VFHGRSTELLGAGTRIGEDGGSRCCLGASTTIGAIQYVDASLRMLDVGGGVLAVDPDVAVDSHLHVLSSGGFTEYYKTSSAAIYVMQ